MMEATPEEIDQTTPEADDLPEDMSLMSELWLFMKERKAWWITPIVVLVVLLGALIVLAQGAGAAAPFIYTLF